MAAKFTPTRKGIGREFVTFKAARRFARLIGRGVRFVGGAKPWAVTDPTRFVTRGK